MAANTPINLNQARKRKARAARRAEADANAAKHGRTKSEKAAARRDAEKAARHVDGHKLDGE